MMRGLLLVSVAALAACSSSSSDTPSGGGTTDASTTDGSGGGTATPAACEAQIVYNQRCATTPEAKSQACADGRRQNCSKTLAAYTPAYAQAVADCTTDQVSCDDGPGNCIDGKLKGVTPSAAAATLRDHFCATCTGVNDCANAFYKVDPDNGNGPGVAVLHWTDDIIQQLDKKCTGSALNVAGSGGDCLAAWSDCFGTVTSSALPNDPDACNPPYTDPGTTDAGTD